MNLTNLFQYNSCIMLYETQSVVLLPLKHLLNIFSHCLSPTPYPWVAPSRRTAPNQPHHRRKISSTLYHLFAKTSKCMTLFLFLFSVHSTIQGHEWLHCNFRASPSNRPNGPMARRLTTIDIDIKRFQVVSYSPSLIPVPFESEC